MKTMRLVPLMLAAALCCAWSPAPKVMTSIAVAMDLPGSSTMLVQVAGHHFKPTLVPDALVSWPHGPVFIVIVTKIGKGATHLWPAQ